MVISEGTTGLEQGHTQTTATFIGTLLKRQRTADNELVQLVFREGDKKWLCVSTNPADAKLPVGKDYHIQGVFRRLGQRAYIYQPRIARLKEWYTPTFTKVLSAAAVTVVIVSAVAVYALLKPSHSGQALGASTNAAQTKATASPTQSPSASATQPVPAPAETPAPTPAAAPSSPTKTPTTYSSPAIPATPTPQPTPTPALVQQPSPTPTPADTGNQATPPTDTSTPAPTADPAATTPPASSPASTTP